MENSERSTDFPPQGSEDDPVIELDKTGGLDLFCEDDDDVGEALLAPALAVDNDAEVQLNGLDDGHGDWTLNISSDVRMV